jgi:hypothetical protein
MEMTVLSSGSPGHLSLALPCISERALEYVDEHDDCPFCLGRAAAHRGDGVETNPFTDVPDASVKPYETDYGLWQVGHHLGSSEPGGLLWFEQPNRSADSGQ